LPGSSDSSSSTTNVTTGWLPERHLPDKALYLLDEACARIPTISGLADLSTGLVVTAHAVAEVLAGWVGVPAEGLLDYDA
jgi:hypothetical protein